MNQVTFPATADLIDAHPDTPSCALPFRSFGRRRRFAGRIRTVKSYQDNVLLKELLGTPSQGDVLVVDGGGSLACALIGDMIAMLGMNSGWAGAVVRDLGTVRIGVAARRGAARPDLSSVVRFRDALVRAESITYGDPARGATTGIHFSRIVDQLDLRGVLAGKTILAANGLDVVQKVARGEAELGFTQVSEILHVDAGTLVGPLPDALQLATTYVAWTTDRANQAARPLGEALTAKQGRERFRAAGFD